MASVDRDQLWSVMNDVEENLVRLSSVKDLLSVAIRRNRGDFESVCYLMTAIDLIDDIEDEGQEVFNRAFDVVMETRSALESVRQTADVGFDGDEVVPNHLGDTPYSLDEETYQQMVRDYDNNVIAFS